MALPPVDGRLISIALAEVDTANFERFGQALYASIMGKRFVPLGGMHDGGAEGFVEPEVFEDTKVEHFLQVSKQKTYESKIKNTVQRLHKFGRHPKSLTYFSSEVIPAIDRLEEVLSDELGCRIRIIDGKYIQTHINDSDATIAAYLSFLEASIAHLARPGASPIAAGLAIHSDRTLAVFLRQEVEHRQGKSGLLESVADSLIIWSLSDTDPDAGVFMSRDEILEKVEATLPSAKQFIRGVIDARLLNFGRVAIAKIDKSGTTQVITNTACLTKLGS